MKIFDINKALLVSDSKGPVDILSFDDEDALVNFFAKSMELLATPASLNELDDIPLYNAKIRFNLGEIYVEQFSLLTVCDMANLLLHGWEFSIKLGACVQNYSLIPLSHLE